MRSRPDGPVLPTLLAAGVIVLSLACGQEPAPHAPPAGVRDSAGVLIVENAVPLWSTSDAWRLADAPRIRIAADGPVAEDVPIDPSNVFRDGRGRWIVGDGMSTGWHAVMVFSSGGRHRENYGRDGGGPCEFRQLWWVAPYRGDSIAAYDYSDHVVAIFAPGGACARVIELPRHQPPIARGSYAYSAGAEGVFGDGSILAAHAGYLDISTGPGLAWYRHALLRISADGTVLDSLGVFPVVQYTWTGERSTFAPYSVDSPVAVLDSTFFFGTGVEYEIREYERAGRLLRIIRRPYERPVIDDATRARFVEWYMEATASSTHPSTPDSRRTLRRSLETEAEWPTHEPALSRIVADRDHVWVQSYYRDHPLHIPPPADSVTWSVFRRDGTWLGEVTVPAAFRITFIGDDEVAGLWKTQEGVAEIRVYAVEGRRVR